MPNTTKTTNSTSSTPKKSKKTPSDPSEPQDSSAPDTAKKTAPSSNYTTLSSKSQGNSPKTVKNSSNSTKTAKNPTVSTKNPQKSSPKTANSSPKSSKNSTNSSPKSPKTPPSSEKSPKSPTPNPSQNSQKSSKNPSQTQANTPKSLTEAEISALLKENEYLKKEVKWLRKLTNSKRFKFAEKVATAYNGVLPKDTRRRRAVEKVGKTGQSLASFPQKARLKKQRDLIAALAKNYDRVIVLNSIPWDTKLKQRPHHLAEEFRKLGFFVVYLEYDNPLHAFRQIRDGLITVNSHEMLKSLRSHPRRYFLTPNNMPTPYKILQEIKSQGYKIIYDYLDEFHEDISGDLSTQIKVWDNLASLSPILCTATATRLYQELEKHLGKDQKIAMARNAVNVDHFNYEKSTVKSPPSDLRPALSKKHPIIGFYGALAPWIDFDLLNQLAENHPEWELVLLGIDYNGAAADLAEAPNIHNLGAKNYQDLPRYAHYFDCAIIPFRQGEIAKATSPVKLFEYMAAGLPTVCTRDLQECAGYDYVYMAQDNADFERLLATAIEDHDNPAARARLLAQAEENTWTNRAEAIAAYLT